MPSIRSQVKNTEVVLKQATVVSTATDSSPSHLHTSSIFHPMHTFHYFSEHQHHA